MPTTTPTPTKKRRYILQVAYLAERYKPHLDKRIEVVLGRKPVDLFEPYVLEDRRWLVFGLKGDLPFAKAMLKMLREEEFVVRAEIMEVFDDGTYAMENKWAWEREAEVREREAKLNASVR